MSRVETTQQYKVQGPDGMEHVIEGPTGASDDEIIEQAKLLFPATPAVKPGVTDNRTASQVRRDQTDIVNENVAEGFKNVFVHPYDTLVKPAMEGASAMNDPAKLLPLATRIYQGAKGPVGTILKGAEILASDRPGSPFYKPDKTKGYQLPAPPTQQDWEESAAMAGQNAGNLIGGELGGELATRGLGSVSKVISGQAAKISSNAALKAKYPYAYTKAIEPFAEAFGVKPGENRFMDFADNADIAMDEINKASKEQFGSSPQSNRQQIEAGKTAMNKIYNEEIGPKVALVENLDLAPLRDKLIAEIPDSFSPAERRLIEKGINDQLTRSMSGTEAEKLRQKFSAADRVEQAANNYVGAALQKTPRGYLFKQMDLGLRDYLAQAVEKVQPGTDIRQALKRYGAVTDITQQAGGIPVDKTTMEMITGRAYITGTTPNITGRIVEAATKKWYANDNLIRRAYAKYEGPVTRPVKPRTGVDTLSGNQQDLISYPDNTDIHGVPPANSAGPLFDNLLQGQNISQAPPMGRRMPESMPPSNTPVNSAESLIRRPVPATEVGPATSLRTTIQARVIPRRANSMPAESQSTVINRQALYGRTTGSPQLTSGPFRFEIHGKVPTELNLGSAAETPRVVQSTSSTSGSMSNRYPPNWQLDSTTYESGRSTEATGQGNLITADPKVVENTIEAIQRYISDHKPRGAKLTELQATRDDLLKQLQKYKAQRGTR